VSVELWKRRTRATKKREEKDEEEEQHEEQIEKERNEEEEQHEEQLEEMSLLQSSPCKPTMVIEVCCHCHEFSNVVKVCCLY